MFRMLSLVHELSLQQWDPGGLGIGSGEPGLGGKRMGAAFSSLSLRCKKTRTLKKKKVYKKKLVEMLTF